MSGLFESKRLVYEALEDIETDKAFVHKILSDPSTIAPGSDGLPKPPRRKESDQFVESKISRSLLFVKICLPPTEDALSNPSMLPSRKAMPIGIVALKKFELDRESTLQTSCGPIYIAPEHRRKGYAAEAMNWVLDWAFRHARMHRVSLQVISANEGAIALYRALGFIEEGRLREAHYFDGKWLDMLQFAMLEAEWRDARASSEDSVLEPRVQG